MNKLSKMAVAAVMSMCAFAAQADFVLDTFSQQQFVEDNDTTDGGKWAPTITLTDPETDLTAPVYRDIFVQKNGQASTNPNQGVSGFVNAIDHQLSYNQDSLQWGFAKFWWAGESAKSDATPWTTEIFDISTNPTGAFNFAYTSDGALQIDITIYDVSGNSTTTTFNTIDTNGGWVNEYIGFNEFTFGGTFDPTSIGAVLVHMNVNNSSATATIDLTIGPAIPEPATIALIGLGLLGAGIAKRRRA